VERQKPEEPDKRINQQKSKKQTDMKPNKMLSYALVAGLMALAVGKAQAGVVIENTLFLPLNIKMTASYVNADGKIAKARLTAKTILFEIWNFPAGTMLAMAPNGDVCAITKTEVLQDLSADGYFSFGGYMLILGGTPPNKYTGGGICSLAFYSDYEAGTDSDYWFQTAGNYRFSVSQSDITSDGYYKVSEKLSAKNLAGVGYNDDLSGSALPITGSASFSGGGKLLD
jgi:hypothetical protein